MRKVLFWHLELRNELKIPPQEFMFPPPFFVPFTKTYGRASPVQSLAFTTYLLEDIADSAGAVQITMRDQSVR